MPSRDLDSTPEQDAPLDSSIVEAKRQQLSTIRDQIDNIQAMDGPVEDGIKPVVVACNAVGLFSNASCEGHLVIPHNNKFMPRLPLAMIKNKYQVFRPFVSICAPFTGDPSSVWVDKPFKYNGLKELTYTRLRRAGFDPQERMDERGLKWTDKQFEQFREIGYHAHCECEKNGLTQEYIDWYRNNEDLMIKATAHVAEFNSSRDISPDTKLRIDGTWGDSFLITSITLEVRDRLFSKNEGTACLDAVQTEMTDFGEFLLNKFFVS